MNLIKLNEQGDLCIKSTYATNRTFSFNIFKCYGANYTEERILGL